MRAGRLIASVGLSLSVLGCQVASPDLLAALPKTIGGATLVYSNSSFGDPISWEVTALKESGRDPSAATVLSGFTSPPVGYGSHVMRIKGMRGEDIVPLMLDGFGAEWSDPSTVSIEGKTLTCYAGGKGPIGPADCEVYFYVLGDAVIDTIGRDDLIAEAVRQLP